MNDKAKVKYKDSNSVQSHYIHQFLILSKRGFSHLPSNIIIYVITILCETSVLDIAAEFFCWSRSLGITSSQKKIKVYLRVTRKGAKVDE